MVKYLSVFIFAFIALTVSSQEFNFRYFNQKEGITEPYIYDIKQSSDGLLWLATSNGLFYYDGLKLQKRDTVFGLSSNFVKSFSFVNDKVVTGHNDGTLSILDNNGAEVLPIRDSIFSPINKILPFNDNEFIGIIQNGGLFKVSGNKKVYFQDIQKDRIYKSIAILDNDLYVASNEGIDIYEIQAAEFKLKGKIEALDYEGVEYLLTYNQNLYIGTEAKGAFIYKAGKLESIGSEIGLNTKKISHIHINNNSIWLTSFGEGIYQFNINKDGFDLRTKIDKNSGLKSPFVNQVFIDREGTIWIGSYGDGLIQLIDQYISNFDLTQEGKYSFTSFFMNDSQYFGAKGTILVQNITNNTTQFYNQSNGLPDKQISAIHVDKNGVIWVGTINDGVYMKPANEISFKKIKHLDNILAKKIHHINTSKEFVLISTSDGLYFLDFDGNLEQHFTTQTGLPHNKIHSTYVDSDNNVFICSNSPAIFYYNRVLKKIDLPKEIGILDIFTIVKDDNDDLWIGTMGNGALKRENGKFFTIAQSEGLASNFCYSIINDNKNRIWISHRDAISNVNISTGKIKSYSKSDLDLKEIEPTATFNSNSDVLWIGNQFGAITFDSKQEVDLNMKPIISLQQVLLDDEFVDAPNQISLGYGKHRIKFTYRGVSLRNPDQVQYQYKLENYDDNWVAVTSQTTVEYNQIYDGDYAFKLRSRIKGGEWTEPAILSTIHVNAPLWKRWWFYFIVLIILVGMVTFVIRKREKSLVRSKQILEERLGERTAQLIEQKNALARQNQDIGDSINYAQRIQNSILPPESILEKTFDDSFILLKPKDIVSGDFYWFEKFDNKVIISAADATGHGVPGAFMSMIGSTLLKELVTNPNVTSPHTFLGLLDERINQTLNQKGRHSDSKDGLDLSVCEICLTSNQLRYSGAYRPAWIHRNGDIIELKGTRESVGGGMNDEPKIFQLHFLQLMKGDTIYLFSDGLTDQFGGEKGKKLKARGLKALILENAQLPLKEQKASFDNFIENWRGENDQIDDILIMAVKI